MSNKYIEAINQKIKLIQNEVLETSNNLDKIAQQLQETNATLTESLNDNENVIISREMWNDAFAAFQGRYVSPIMVRKHTDEFAVDARKRLKEIDMLINPNNYI